MSFRICTKMHQEYFSILSAKVPSGSLPRSIPYGFSARVHSGSVFSCPACVCLVRRNLYKRFSFKRSFPSAVSECKRFRPYLNVRSHQRRKFSSLTYTYRRSRSQGHGRQNIRQFPSQKKMRQPSFFAPRKKHLAAKKNDEVDFLQILFTDVCFFWDRRITVI